MRKTPIGLAILGLLFLAGMADRPVSLSSRKWSRAGVVPPHPAQGASIPAAVKPTVIRDFGKVPVYFIPNDGQMDGPVDFYVQGKDKTVYFTPEGVTYALSYGSKPESEKKDIAAAGRPRQLKDDGLTHDPSARPEIHDQGTKRWAVKMDFVGARKDAKPEGVEKTGARISYFKGNQEDWHAGLETYSKIVYRDLWPGIDLVYKGDIDKLKYEFIVHPGADPAAIKMALRGVEKAAIDDEGCLEIETPAGQFEDETPLAYQDIGGKRADVSMAFKLAESEEGEDAKPGMKSYSYGFEVGAYNKSQELGLDPATFVYCGYLGGSGDDYGDGIAVDSSGNAYVTGGTSSTESTFPKTAGPDLTYNGNYDDAFVAKVKLDGTTVNLVYCGYIGGSSIERGNGIAIDGSGNAYVTGETNSTQATFPVALGPDLTQNGGSDAFVAKVNPTGSALIYCGYIGGSGYDYGRGIAVDGSGNAYVSGYTYSNEATFPETVGPDLTQNGNDDAFVAKVNPAGTALVYCGYIGGSGEDYDLGIAVDGSGNAYVTGETYSTQATFPVALGPDLTRNGGKDAFVAKVNSSGSGLVYCGYIGGSSDDFGRGIAVDGSGNAFVTGQTYSTQATFPVTLGPDLTQNGSGDAFVAKIQNGVTLTMAAGPGGTTSPAPGTYTFDEGTSGNVQALPSPGYRFDRWTGDVPAGQETNATIFITMDANKSLTASFKKAWTLTIFSATGGTTNPAAGAHGYDDGTVVLIAATAAGGYRFDHWTGDVPAGSATINPLSLTMNADKSITPVFIRQYTLTITTGTGGTTNPVPGTYTYDEGASASVQAVPAAAYQLNFWSGNASGSANPVTVVMNENKSIQANFTRVVKSPLSLTGDKLANRSVSMVEYVARLRWQANPANSGTITYRVYRIENGQATAVGDVPAGALEYFVRRLQQARAYRFGVKAVNSQGWESDLVEVSVQ
jgi:hypothetical protein